MATSLRRKTPEVLGGKKNPVFLKLIFSLKITIVFIIKTEIVKVVKLRN